MAWSCLPDDLAELILGKLSLVALGRVATTCRSFHTFFCRRMAEQQKAQCDLAVTLFGRERVTVLADIVDGFLKGERLRATTPDGVVLVGQEPHFHHVASQEPSEAGHIKVRYGGYPKDMYVQMRTPNQASVHVWVHSTEKKVVIMIFPNRGVGLEGVSLVHALLSWGISVKHDAWPHADVRIQWMAPRSMRTGSEAELAPLLPLVAQHKNWRITRWLC